MKGKIVSLVFGIFVVLLCCGCGKEWKGAEEKEKNLSPTKAQEAEATLTPTITAEPEKIKGSIQTISDFYSEELDTKNVVRIYLPPEYEKSEESYSVIYMFDGQNLFDYSTATYQKEWHIDETLDNLYQEKSTKGMIVVGVDSVAARRNKEYNLYLNAYEGGGEGDVLKVCDFYANTLKKYIDENYRTKTDREHTAVIGASYGAVAAICASTRYPEVYGYTGMFSYCDNQNPEKMTAYIKEHMTPEILTDNRIYFYTGKYDFAYQSTKGAYEIAKENKLENIWYELDEGQHDEYSWGGKFTDCLNFFHWIE